jgi:hypothetical protein
VLDSASKLPPDGLLEGSFLLQLGNYDECLSIKGPLNEDGVPRFRGKYCRVLLGFKSTNQTDNRGQLLLMQMKMASENINLNSNGIAMKNPMVC